MKLWPALRPGATALDCDIGDIYALIRAVLPTFLAIAERTRNNLPDTGSDKTRKFYLHLNTSVISLDEVLVQWDPTETVHRIPEDEDRVKKNLMRILNELENVFVSRKKEAAGQAFERLRFNQEDETYPKLRALRRTLPQGRVLDEDFLKDVGYIMRLHTKDTKKQDRMLRNLKRAHDFFSHMQPFAPQSNPSCPIRFSHYPLKHIRKLADTLFGVVQTNWCCQCRSSESHVNRKTRLNLTQHQRFETSPVDGQIFWESKARFRILFPTNTHDEWQDTDIDVTELGHVKAEHAQPRNGLCGIIQGVKAGIRPRMVVYAQRLWQLEADPETNRSSSPQVGDGEFKSLKDLLQSDRRKLVFSSSSIEGKDRLILSFILATSLLHFIHSPWLQASFNSESICFRVSDCESVPDITKPYLTTSFTSLVEPPKPRDLNQPHPFPDILSLGVALLEIAKWSPIDFKEREDLCVVALKCKDEWMKPGRKGSSGTVHEGVRQAISACIEPRESRIDELNRNSTKDAAVRKFIFERVLYPLGDALSTAYDIDLNMLHADIGRENEVRGIGSIDHQGESRQEKQEAGDEWLRRLGKVHDLFDKCQDRYRELRKVVKKETRVKVAVLDTGLQLPGALQENYEDAERINCGQSASFIPITRGQASQEWKLDCDGHGSRVGEIILNVAPTADLHVAKVFETRDDLADPKMVTQVHKSIAEAINRATNEWKVDMIIM